MANLAGKETDWEENAHGRRTNRRRPQKEQRTVSTGSTGHEREVDKSDSHCTSAEETDEPRGRAAAAKFLSTRSTRAADLSPSSVSPRLLAFIATALTLTGPLGFPKSVWLHLELPRTIDW